MTLHDPVAIATRCKAVLSGDYRSRIVIGNSPYCHWEQSFGIHKDRTIVAKYSITEKHTRYEKPLVDVGHVR